MKMNEPTREYIRQHASDDVRQLALQGSRDQDIDLTLALQQIAGRQTARRKLPSWAAVEDLVYPPHLNMEQCSSEQTARYKMRIANACSGNGTFIDLTGGFGIDFYWMSQSFQQRCYVEQDEMLCSLARHNFALLHLPCSVNCGTAETFLRETGKVDLIFLDPARRNEQGRRTYGIADCTPNVLELLPLLREKADRVFLKLSPMLDWRKAVEDLSNVSTIHIVSVDNECKELLVEIKYEDEGGRDTDNRGIRVVCVNIQKGQEHLFDYHFPQEPQPVSLSSTSDARFLYEPNASIMKAGCFDVLEARYPVRQVAQNSHLFLTPDEIDDFPGRGFQILAISSVNKKKLSKILVNSDIPMERANITVRNFPLTAEQLRKKLQLKDGGDLYLFATTAADGSLQLFICRKIG